jgi:hypothetical protein
MRPGPAKPALPFAPAQPYIPLSSNPRLAERKPMSRKATQRLSFFLLMGLTLYAALWGAG